MYINYLNIPYEEVFFKFHCYLDCFHYSRNHTWPVIANGGDKSYPLRQANQRADYLFPRSSDNPRFRGTFHRILERKRFTADSLCLFVSIPFVRRRSILCHAGRISGDTFAGHTACRRIPKGAAGSLVQPGDSPYVKCDIRPAVLGLDRVGMYLGKVERICGTALAIPGDRTATGKTYSDTPASIVCGC